MTASAVFTPCTDEQLLLDADIELKSANLRLLQSTVRANLPSSTKLVAMVLCCHHNDNAGCAWPSVARLAKLCGMHRTTVEKHLTTLKELGLVLVGKVAGVRTPAYALQEKTLQSVAIEGIAWAKNMLGSADFLKPAPVPPAAPNAVKTDTTSENAVQGTEERGLTEGTERTGGTGARATPPAPPVAPAPATPAVPEPTSPPDLFASQAPEAQTAGLAESSAAFVPLVDQINAQRASNGKKPFTLADIAQLRVEAAKSGITAVQAAQWILERTGRNFFKADYFAPPAPAPVATTAPQPAPQPAPAPALTAEEQAEQEAAATAARAKLKSMFSQPASAATPAPAADMLIVPRTGHAWADSAIAEALAGQPVAVRRLEMACEVAKVGYSVVRAAQKRAAAALTAIAA